MSWLCWFLLVPLLFLGEGLLREVGLPPLDTAALLCLFLALFARASALPGLVLGAALGRALVDDACLPVQVLVLAVPVALLLPLRTLFFRQRWLWQGAAAAFAALAIPKLAGLCGTLFDQPSAGAELDGVRVAVAAVGLPPLLLLLRRVPPLQPFTEAMP
ncbi:MAG TPA: hypothetical protein VK348_04630 [Planctomycetota bacterium]|nr:hypothetical protein [Planctomycetota bacterium]